MNNVFGNGRNVKESLTQASLYPKYFVTMNQVVSYIQSPPSYFSRIEGHGPLSPRLAMQLRFV